MTRVRSAGLYSAAAVKHLFWLNEARATARLFADGLSRDEIKKIVLDDNLYQVKSTKRAIEILGAVYRRLASLPTEIVQKIAALHIGEAKILNLVGMLKTDRLFFELAYEIYREKVIIKESTIRESDIYNFFHEKRRQSDVVNSWTEGTFLKLKQAYLRMMIEAGLISDAKERAIQNVYVDYRVKEALCEHGLSIYLEAFAPE